MAKVQPLSHSKQDHYNKKKRKSRYNKKCDREGTEFELFEV